MKIVHETELMKNQKASSTVVPDKQFEALQTVEGNALLFSIGLDGILFCTREVPGDTHGWVRINLSSNLSQSCYNGAAVTAKTFDIAQDLTYTNSVDIALVVTVNGIDYLHIVTGFNNTLDNWASNAPVFDATNQYKFDYPGDNNATYQAMQINEVQILDSNDGNGTQYIIVDLLNPASHTLERFYIDVTKQHGYAWLPHNLQATLSAGKVSSFIGCGPNDGPNNDYNVGGVYVLGTVNNTAQLFYTPTCNYLHPEEHAESTIFNLPAGYDPNFMAMALSAPAATAPYTDMFFASNGTLYFLANADQVDTETTNATPKPIYTHELFNNIQSIHVKNWNDNIVLWGQSQYTDTSTTPATTGSRLFIMECAAGHETDSTAWSVPITLLLNVENSSAYVNNNYSLDSSIDSDKGNAYGSCNVLFAHQADGNLVQLFQDPVTSAWQERNLLIVPNDITTVYETTTYSTHIEITDEFNVAAPGTPVFVWSSSPCSVYISDANLLAAYSTLDITTPLNLTTDSSGNITIMQPVDTIGGVSYYVAVQDPATKQWYTQAINPLSGTITNLNTKVPDDKNDHLAGVTVTDEYGTHTPLVSSTEATQSTSASINTICQQNVNVNSDGLVTGLSWPDPAASVAALLSAKSLASVKPIASAATKSAALPKVKHTVPSALVKNRVKKFAKPDRQFKHIRFNPNEDKIWAWTFGENAKHYEGIEAVKALGVVPGPNDSLALTASNVQLGSIFSHIESKIGHIVKWMKSEAHKLEMAVITFTDGVIDCLLTIAGEIYHFVAKCANDIVNLVHTVLNAIKTAFEDIVKWIGMIFNFKDILRTHTVLKNVINIIINDTRDNFAGIKDKINDVFTTFEDKIAQLTDLDAIDPTYNSCSAKATPQPGSKSPSANWANQQMKSNGRNTASDYAATPSDDPTNGLLNELYNLIIAEGDAFSDAGSEIKAIGEKITSQPITTSILQIVGVISELLAKTAQNILLAAVDVLKAMMDGVTDTFNATIQIPVISKMYNDIVGGPFTVLDVVCLIAAFPITVIYKATRGEAPFPEGAMTDSLTGAKSMAELQTILCPPSASAAHWEKDYHVTVGSAMDRLTIAGNIAALAGAFFMSWITLVKSEFPKVPGDAEILLNKKLTPINSALYMLYVLPDAIVTMPTWGKLGNPWCTDFNSVCTSLGIGKAVVDAFSPWMKGTVADTYNNWVAPASDFIINATWQIPTTFGFYYQFDGKKANPSDANEIVSFIGGTTFDISGMLSPLLVKFSNLPEDPEGTREIKIAAVAYAIGACNLIWGGSCVVTSFDGLPNG